MDGAVEPYNSPFNATAGYAFIINPTSDHWGQRQRTQSPSKMVGDRFAYQIIHPFRYPA